MTGELLLAVDAGTGSCRAVAFRPDGTEVAIGRREYTHREEPGVPGSQAFDTARNWQLICEAIREVVDATGPDAIAAVSATSMREGMVLYDHSGAEIWACPNVDSRARAQAAELVASGEAQEIYEQAGDWVSITAPARFRWLAEQRPELFAEIAHVGMLGDWILTRLSGAYVTDASLGSSSGMFDLAGRTWSGRVAELCGLDLSVLPDVVESGTPIGEVTVRAAEETGLRAGTPVVAGGADTQLALLGIGVTEPGTCTIVGGSFWQLATVLNTPAIDPEARLRTLCHSVPERWMIEGIGFYCGIVMRWFRDAFCGLERQEAAASERDVYELLEERAALIPPGANGVFGIFSNLMNARRWVHAAPAFVGFDMDAPSNGATAACFRAIEESAAYVSRGHLEIVREVTGIDPDAVVMTGGAAKGQLWPQIVANALGRSVRIPVVKESSALGAAICAGLGTGLYKEAGEAARAVTHYEREFDPDDDEATYSQLYDRWLELYRRALALSEDDLVRPLWRAAGV